MSAKVTCLQLQITVFSVYSILLEVALQKALERAAVSGLVLGHFMDGVVAVSYTHLGKSPEKPKGFFWSVQGGPGEIESPPPGSFSFPNLFFWRSKRKCWAAAADF